MIFSVPPWIPVSARQDPPSAQPAALTRLRACVQRYMSYAKHKGWSKEVHEWTLSFWIHYASTGNLGPLTDFDFESWSCDPVLLETQKEHLDWVYVLDVMARASKVPPPDMSKYQWIGLPSYESLPDEYRGGDVQVREDTDKSGAKGTGPVGKGRGEDVYPREGGRETGPKGTGRPAADKGKDKAKDKFKDKYKDKEKSLNKDKPQEKGHGTAKGKGKDGGRSTSRSARASWADEADEWTYGSSSARSRSRPAWS